MRGDCYLTDAENAECTIRISMPLKNWREIHEALKESRESGPWRLNDVIYKLVTDMQKHFYSRGDETHADE